MIEGRLDNEGNKLFFEIGLVAVDEEIIPVEALLDTGFTDWLAINTQDLESLGWLCLDDELPMATAQGEAEFNVYVGSVQIDGQEFQVPVLGGDSINEILLGMRWLKTRRLVVDFLAGVLTLG
ncbi:MAG TPA: aspartyl protease [Cyanobacteria bacterium UBA11370]|nr:aspartyl protease [Cyanobacteria bacterium UBA11370]HBY79457.1 aspartyl protease [Cyanobacteria bacterium UBA11148]